MSHRIGGRLCRLAYFHGAERANRRGALAWHGECKSGQWRLRQAVQDTDDRIVSS
jgi:hypothetical protein